MSESVYLSVLVPIRNEEGSIGQTLNSLVRQDYPKDRYEIIVVDGRSSDGTRSVVERFICQHRGVSIRLLDNPGRWSSRARNIGVRAAHGKLIAVIDGHVHIPNGRLLAAMERLKEEHGALCLGRPAPLLAPDESRGMPLWIALARKSWLGHSRSSYIYSDYEGWIDPCSSGFAYDREVFTRVGYFDEAFDAAEDFEFHYRLKQDGIRAYTSPDLTINSFARPTLRGLFGQMVRYGVGRARLLWKHPGSFTKETLVPPAIFLFFSGVPLTALAAYWLPVVGWAWVAVLAIYFSILLATGWRLSSGRSRAVTAFGVAMAAWTVHIGLGWGFLRTILFPQRRYAGYGRLIPDPSGAPGIPEDLGTRPAPANSDVAIVHREVAQ